MADEPRERGILDRRVESVARPVVDDVQRRERRPRHVPQDLKDALAPRYEIDRAIGEGGMAVVYKAYDKSMKRHVAIKALRPELADGLTADRFELEISVAARLDHPRIVPLHDRGVAAGSMYYVMRLVDGESLRDRIEAKRQLDVRDAIEIARHVAEALDFAHAQGVLHRDIKPENVLLDNHGAYVADFGIARLLDVVGDERITATGMAVGTAPYMSPEQISTPRELTGLTDVYSLACVLYEMLAGEPPYTGRSARDVLNKHLAAAIPDLSVVRPAVSARMQRVIASGLEKTPADRCRSAKELVDSFQRAFEHSSEEPSAAPRARTLAILPFANMSGNQANEYFGDGIADELIHALIRAGGIRVVARSSSFYFKGKQADIREIGQALGASHVLEGSVRVQGTQLRATAQLVDAASGHPLWSERFDRSLEDVFAVQDEITTAIADRLQRHLEEPTQASDDLVFGDFGATASRFARKPADASIAPQDRRGAAPASDPLRERLVAAVRGDYEILEEAGRGHLCVVYRAKEAATHREVAIKTLLEPLVPQSAAWTRFVREAQIAAGLDHPNIVPVYAVREAGQVLLIVQRFVSGKALRRVLKRDDVLPFDAAMTVLRDVAGALDHAHRRGVVHRSLRPGNIIIDTSGHVLVNDFSSAVLADSTSMSTPVPTRNLDYMSPEQIGGQAVTGAADQYALGAIAFEMLAGRTPFFGDTYLEVLQGHLFGELPDQTVLPPTQAAGAVRRMLSKRPEERFASCADAVNAMGTFQETFGRMQLASMAKGEPQGTYAGAARAPATALRKSVPVSAPLSRPTLPQQLIKWVRSLFTPVPEAETRVRMEGPSRATGASVAMMVPTATPQQRFSAYDEYLRGKFVLSFESTAESIGEAIARFDAAIEADPRFAAAHSARALALTMLARAGVTPKAGDARRAQMDAIAALRIDSNLAAAHVATALVSMFFKRDHAHALRTLDEATARNPAYAEVHLWRGFARTWLKGDADGAIRSLNRAVDLDPLSLATRVELAFAYMLKGDLDQALRDADAAVESGQWLGSTPRSARKRGVQKPVGESTGSASAFYARGLVRAQIGRLDDALADALEASRLGGRQAMHRGLIGYVHAKRGDTASGHGVIAKLEGHGAEGAPVATALAMVHAGLGNADRAIASLRDAVEKRDVNIVFVPFGPQFATLKSAAGYAEVVDAIRRPLS